MAASLLPRKDRERMTPLQQLNKLGRIAKRAQAKADWLRELERQFPDDPTFKATEAPKYDAKAKAAVNEAIRLNNEHGGELNPWLPLEEI